MIPIRHMIRLLNISTVLSRYRLDEITEAAHLFRPVRLIRVLAPWWGGRGIEELPRGERFRMALEELGPIFVKFGQVLSTRRDLLPPDIADQLAMLQDQVGPFPGSAAREVVEQELGQSVDQLFSRFDTEPLASASVAQVHAAELADGSQVVVKVLRPGVRERIKRDVDLLKTIAGMAERYWPAGRQVRPAAIVAELEKTIYNELDLQREAANASQLRRNWEGSKDLYVPAVHWPYCKPGVMVMERVSGIPIDDVEALKAAGADLTVLSRRGLEIFYTQVFRDNFFHADMHPGNILVDVSDPADPTYIAMDFGIVGSLPDAHLHYLAENFTAFFDQDYRRVAELHIEAGWIKDTVRLDELESAIRTVCEPQLSRPLSEISFAGVLYQLFEVARHFDLVVQPELVLLQKTLLNIEGLGRQLDPDLNIWATAKPMLEKILRDRYGLDAAAKELANRLPRWLERIPEMPGLVHEYLQKATNGELEATLHNRDLARLQRQSQLDLRRSALAIVAAGLFISASVLIGLDVTPLWRTWSIPGLAVAALATLTTWRAL
jgi:ubiquinone biosynthesis protein